MSKHTPGPWRVDTSSIRAKEMPKWRELYPEASDHPSRGMPVCMFHQPSYQAPIETIERINRTNEANARLIAAAPDLLAALHVARLQLKADLNTRIQQPIERDCNQIILEAIDDAIAKAEGES